MPERDAEVWCESTQRWVSGYRLIESLPDGTVRVARPGGEPLPVPIARDRVRSQPVKEPWAVLPQHRDHH